MRIDLTLIDVKRVTDELTAKFPDDAELLGDMLEGCTDLHELASRLVQSIEDEDGVIDALKEQIATRNSRKKRATDRKTAKRQTLADLMAAGQQTKLVLPEATVSRSTVKPKRIVTDAYLLPEQYREVVTTIKPDTDAIKKADTDIPGTAMDNGGERLTVRMN